MPRAAARQAAAGGRSARSLYARAKARTHPEVRDVPEDTDHPLLLRRLRSRPASGGRCQRGVPIVRGKGAAASAPAAAAARGAKQRDRGGNIAKVRPSAGDETTPTFEHVPPQLLRPSQHATGSPSSTTQTCSDGRPSEATSAACSTHPTVTSPSRRRCSTPASERGASKATLQTNRS